MNSNHCHEWPIFHQVVFRRPSLSSEFHFESTESKSLISTQSLFSLASRIKTQTVCPSRIWWLSNSEEGSVPSGKDVLVFLCTAFSISIHNLLAALCWTSVGLPSWQEGHIPSECKCSENTLAASYNYILFGQYLLSYFGLMHQYVLFLCRTWQTKANNQLSSIATKRSKLLWFVFCATFGANTSSTKITWGARMWKIGHRHGRGPSNGRDTDRRVVQVSQYLGRSLVSKQQATCNQVLCMQPHRGVYRMRPPRYTLLGPKFETNAPAFSRNTVQVPAVLVAAHWTKLASAKWSISSSDSVHLVYRG